MFQLPNYIRYRRELLKQSRAQRKLEQRRPPDTQESYDSGALDDFHRQDEDLYEWKRLIQTRYYRNKADRLLVLMPDYDEDGMYEQVEWDKDPRQPRYLTDKGLRAVDLAIREKEKLHREAAGFWIGIMIGLIGAVTGLVSVFKS